MIGYCATGSSGIAIAPIRQMNSATTQAKIGRSMKKLGMALPDDARGVLVKRVGTPPFGPDLRLHSVAGGKFLEAFDHDAIAGLQSVGDEPLAVLHRAGADGLHDDAVVVLHDEHLAAAAAIALDGLLRNCDGVTVDALLDADAHIHARQQFALRVWKLAAQRHLPGVDIDAGVGEQELAVEGI